MASAATILMTSRARCGSLNALLRALAVRESLQVRRLSPQLGVILGYAKSAQRGQSGQFIDSATSLLLMTE
ncbi:MAG: hypothetical protein AAFM92_10805 [Pseudomonadota bacterium]